MSDADLSDVQILRQLAARFKRDGHESNAADLLRIADRLEQLELDVANFEAKRVNPYD